uniref:Putative alpha amylase catalytic domain family found in maltase n=1 Tax=Culex tarsalis TaxID=7177 RepID=A0A1Q3F270_CULTA
MTVNEKTRLLPKDYQKSYVIPIPQDDINNNNNNNNNGSEYDYGSYALTKAELSSYIDDPFWVRVRYVCFSLYWLLCLVALFVSCYIAVSALESGRCTAGAGASSLNGDGNNSLVSTTTVSTLDQTTETTIGSADGSGVIFRLLNRPA